MHVVFVCSEFPLSGRPTGGFGTYVDNISAGLIKLGVNVTIVCKAEKPDVMRQKGRKIIAVAGLNPKLKHSFLRSPLSLIRRIVAFLDYPLFYSLAVLRNLRRLDNIEPVDIIEGGDFGAELFFYLLTRKKTAPRVVIKLHTPSFVIRRYNKEPKNWFYLIMEFIEAFVIKEADGINSPTQALAEIVEEKLRVKVSRIIPYPLPHIEASRSKVKRDPNLIVYVGKLQRKKGVGDLIEAIPLVIKKYPQLRLLLIGPDTISGKDSYKSLLTNKLKANGAIAWVTFYDPLPQKELFAHLRQAAVTVIPSIWENFPNVIFEATENESAVVATNTGGIGEMVRHKIEALLVPPQDAKALAKALIKLLALPLLRATLVSGAKKRFESVYAPRLIASQTYKLYQEVLKNV